MPHNIVTSFLILISFIYDVNSEEKQPAVAKGVCVYNSLPLINILKQQDFEKGIINENDLPLSKIKAEELARLKVDSLFQKNDLVLVNTIKKEISKTDNWYYQIVFKSKSDKAKHLNLMVVYVTKSKKVVLRVRPQNMTLKGKVSINVMMHKADINMLISTVSKILGIEVAGGKVKGTVTMSLDRNVEKKELVDLLLRELDQDNISYFFNGRKIILTQ